MELKPRCFTYSGLFHFLPILIDNEDTMGENHFKINKGITLNPQTTAPTTPTEGDAYYDKTLKTFVLYNNGNWINLSSRVDVASAASLTSADFTTTVVQHPIIKITGSTASNVHGLSAAPDAKAILVYNAATQNITLKHQSVTEGTPANRLITYDGLDVTLIPGQCANLMYDSTQARWIAVNSNLVISTTDNAVARFDGTNGKPQNSGVTLNDLNEISGATKLDVDNVQLDGNTVASTDTNGNIELEPNGSGLVRSTKKSAWSDSMAVGQNAAADSSAILELESTSKGLLLPRMTAAQRNAISSPAAGLNVYNTDSSKPNYYNGTLWKETADLPTTTKGDLVVHNGTTDVRLPVGANSEVLSADSSQATGLLWIPQGRLNVVSVTGTTSATTVNDVIFASGGAFTITLPAASNTGKVLRIKKTDSSLANIITISRAGGDTIDGATTTTLNTLGEVVELVADGSTTWRVMSRDYDTSQQTYSLTIGGTTTAPTKATTATVDVASWHRDGKFMVWRYVYEQPALGAPDSRASGSGDYLFPLPSGASIDTTNLGNTYTQGHSSLGSGVFWYTGNEFVTVSHVANSGNLWMTLVDFSGAATGNLSVGGTYTPLGATGAMRWSYVARIPISGWN